MRIDVTNASNSIAPISRQAALPQRENALIQQLFAERSTVATSEKTCACFSWEVISSYLCYIPNAIGSGLYKAACYIGSFFTWEVQNTHPSPTAIASYSALPFTGHHKNEIRRIMTVVANDVAQRNPATTQCLIDFENLDAHPLRVLEFIYTDPILSKTISDLWFGNNNHDVFLRMARCLERTGNLSSHIQSFAAATTKDIRGVREQISSHNWDGLIEHMVHDVMRKEFEALPLTDQNKTDIRFVLTSIATTRPFPEAEVAAAQQRLQNVHPFVFLSFAYKEDALASHLWSIDHGPLEVRVRLAAILVPELTRQKQNGTLLRHAYAFAASMTNYYHESDLDRVTRICAYDVLQPTDADMCRRLVNYVATQHGINHTLPYNIRFAPALAQQHPIDLWGFGFHGAPITLPWPVAVAQTRRTAAPLTETRDDGWTRYVQEMNAARHNRALGANQDGGIFYKTCIDRHLASLPNDQRQAFRVLMDEQDASIYLTLPRLAVEMASSSPNPLAPANLPLFLQPHGSNLETLRQNKARLASSTLRTGETRESLERTIANSIGSIATALSRQPNSIAAMQLALEQFPAAATTSS